MKFYIQNNKNISYWNISNKLTYIYCDRFSINFFKNGLWHNNKNAAFIKYNGYKEFSLNGEIYDYENKFNKSSWRRFVKMQVFL